ncbi:bromo-adjacent-like proteiny (BAH) domain-containing protein [Forsythia ovata]|uniref:Bromo-adjacent-like proteiny (BAH) domain-containing protein n=1 Tax=Forsythia ovata TaxID=205694 RepID=A0ABD1SNC0_9LAMI
MMVIGQWFYRLEEAEKIGGGNWESRVTRELFYSFHRNEVSAKSKVYDTEQKRLFKLTDKDYEDDKQHEIDLLVQKTISRIGDLPDLEPEYTTVNQEDHTKNKRLLRKRNMPPLDVAREEE